MRALALNILLKLIVSICLISTPCWLWGADKILTFRLLGEPETLDWNRAHTPFETYILTNLMEGLVGLDSNLKIVPALAHSWKVSSDGRTFRFKLRSNVKWSDGVVLKAKDFVYSWKRLLTPATAASYAYFLYDIENAESYNQGKIKDFEKVGVRALDDFTLEVKLKHSVAHWLYVPTFWVTFPLREDVVQKQGSSWEIPKHIVTLGPYLLSEHVLESKIVMKKNPFYYGKRGNVDQIVGQVVSDDATALNLYEAGKLDFLTDISLFDLKRLEKRADLKTFPYLKVGYLGWVTDDQYPTSNVKLRRAIAMSIDKGQLAELLHGGQTPATSFVPPLIMGYSKDVGLKFDPIQARAELRASGLDFSRPIRLGLTVLNLEKALVTAQFIQNELKKNLGLEVILYPYDNKTYRSKLNTHAYAGFLTGWSADYPDPDNFLSVFLSYSGNNHSHWKNIMFDTLTNKAAHSLNQLEREKKYIELQKILLQKEAIVVPLYYEPIKALMHSRVRNLELNPVNYLNLKKVDLVD